MRHALVRLTAPTLVLLSGCGVILGDQQVSPPVQWLIAGVIGIALGYGYFRWAQHGVRENRRERRDERRDDRG